MDVRPLPAPSRRLRLALTACAFALQVACSGGGSAPAGQPAPTPTPTPTPAAPTVSYIAGAIPQMQLTYADHQVMVSLLRDDLAHIAYSDHLAPGTPYFSPMLANTAFNGPQGGASYDAAAHRLSAAGIAVELDGSCLRIASVGADARTLTRACASEAPLTLTLSAEDSTEVFGLGQQVTTGHTVPSWLGTQRTPGSAFGNAMTGGGSIGNTGNTQVPVAYVLGPGMRNYGLFFDTPYPLTLNFVGNTWSVASTAPSLGMFVFSGPDLPTLRRTYMGLTGTPPVPPLKAFGLWLSEYGFDNWAELDGKVATLRTQGFPLDGAVLDLQWFGGIVSGSDDTHMGHLAWDGSAFPDARARVAGYANAGLGLMTIEESYIGKNLPEHALLAGQRYLAMACGAPCTTPVYLTANSWWGKGGMIDWSNAQGAAWWHDTKRRALIDDGVLGHWTDLGEPEMFDSGASYQGFNWYGAQVSGHRDVHNLYNFFWSQSIAEGSARTHPARRPWILSRSGSAGSQRFGVAMWSGDVASSFDTLGAQMTSQANMSLSGFDYYGSDVGGFQRNGVQGAALDTLYTRWLVTSSLLDIPVRPHTENLCNCKETAPDRVGDRASNLAALRLRYQLAPYLYSLAHSAWQDGEPMFPPLVYHFQMDTAARAVSRSKMIGPWLLFTGLTAADATATTYLPRGSWVDFYHPERSVASTGAASAQPVLVDGLVRAPLFMREGAIVPMLRSAPASLVAGAAKPVHWFDDLLLRVYPQVQQSRFTLFEDDGASRAYQSGTLARTAIGVQQMAGGGVHITIAPDNRTGSSAKRKLALDVVQATSPGQVTVNGKAPAGGWSLQGHLLRIELGEVDVDASQDIQISP